jgi:hypothetical protein
MMKNYITNSRLLIFFAVATVTLMIVVLYLTFNELVQQSAMDNARRTVYQQRIMQAQHIEVQQKNEAVKPAETLDQTIDSILSTGDEQSVVDNASAEVPNVSSEDQSLDSINQVIYE